MLLHLLRTAGVEAPIVFFREPWQPHKYRFQESVIREWDLLVYTWHPQKTAVQQNDDEFEIQNWYQLNNTVITCPSGIVPPAENMPWACGIEMLQRPKQEYLATEPIQAAWIGHKRCDTDKILGGDIGTRVQARMMADQMSLLFPIRDWSHDDVWEYIETRKVPYDMGRYEKIDGKWRERPHMKYNADYVHACTACMDKRPGAPRVVYCPKLQCEIETNVEKVPWVEPKRLDYMKD